MSLSLSPRFIIGNFAGGDCKAWILGKLCGSATTKQRRKLQQQQWQPQPQPQQQQLFFGCHSIELNQVFFNVLLGSLLIIRKSEPKM